MGEDTRDGKEGAGRYEALDAEILRCIGAGGAPLYNRFVGSEARKIAEAEQREEFRVIDARLKAMKKAGKIKFVRGKNAHWDLAASN